MPNHEERDNSGALFKNQKRGDNEKAPHYKGRAVVDGKPYWVSAWVKTAKSGDSYMSLSLQPREEPVPF